MYRQKLKNFKIHFMKVVSRIFLIISFCLLIYSCSKKEYIYLNFSVGYEDDTIKVIYNNNVLIDTIITTNYSTGQAYSYILPMERLQDQLLVNINDSKDTIELKVDSLKILSIRYLDRILTYQFKSTPIILE